MNDWTPARPWCLICGRSDRKRRPGKQYCCSCNPVKAVAQRAKLLVAMSEEVEGQGFKSSSAHVLRFKRKYPQPGTIATHEVFGKVVLSSKAQRARTWTEPCVRVVSLRHAVDTYVPLRCLDFTNGGDMEVLGAQEEKPLLAPARMA